jgi:hypothetical protein
VLVFGQKVTLEAVIEIYAFVGVEASMRVTNGMPFGCRLLLTVATLNCVETLKASWIWAADVNSSQHYAQFRHVLQSPTLATITNNNNGSTNANNTTNINTHMSSDTSASAPKTIQRALLFITSWVEPTLLAAYKFYVAGTLVSLG